MGEDCVVGVQCRRSVEDGLVGDVSGWWLVVVLIKRPPWARNPQ